MMRRGIPRPGTRVGAFALAAVAALTLLAATQPAPPAGPPFPEPVTGQRVYDFAGALRPATEQRAQATAEAIETRTGAQVVVFTQLKPGATQGQTEDDAIALIDQWGIGRRGFDDGLVIFYNLDESLAHGQVQLYAAPGFRATFLTNEERQAIFENDMLPLLRVGDLDGATLAALAKVDTAATPENAQRLRFGRQVDALLGLVGAPLAFIVLFGWAAFHWVRFGRDPEYIDDSSIYAAGPPAELTPAAAALVLDGWPSRRALTAAMLDLAARGEFVFREHPQGSYGSVGVRLGSGAIDDRQRVINQHRPLGKAERAALEQIRMLGLEDDDRYIDPKALRRFGSITVRFDHLLEQAAVDNGWFTDRPRRVRNHWFKRGAQEILLAVVVLLIAAVLPSGGLTLLGASILLAAIATVILAPKMPARTLPGAMIRAMLAAYRRTLAATMAGARSMNQVVDEARLPWLETPDQAVVWGTAVGLQPEIEAVLGRSLEDLEAGRASPASTYLPGWYYSNGALAISGAAGGAGPAPSGGIGSPVAGLLSSSALPAFGGMFAALGTIGDTLVTTSSGGSSAGSSSSSSSFGGGSSGGGGGGAGGGF
ncbi:MAG: DUF2207 domain-containing protein [Chloroflexi bacterium]|nr:DUF2207 domain-containing protein [Chloroflexota bacterium]